MVRNKGLRGAVTFISLCDVLCWSSVNWSSLMISRRICFRARLATLFMHHTYFSAMQAVAASPLFSFTMECVGPRVCEKAEKLRINTYSLKIFIRQEYSFYCSMQSLDNATEHAAEKRVTLCHWFDSHRRRKGKPPEMIWSSLRRSTHTCFFDMSSLTAPMSSTFYSLHEAYHLSFHLIHITNIAPCQYWCLYYRTCLEAIAHSNIRTHLLPNHLLQLRAPTIFKLKA